MNLEKILEYAHSHNASDIHLTVGSPAIMRVNSELVHIDDKKLMPKDIDFIVNEALSPRLWDEFKDNGAVDIAYSIPHVGRFRINIFKQRGSFALAIRVVALEIPDIDAMQLPVILKKLSELKRGLILVTGPTGSGKSTTLAAMINYMNQTRNEHIITIEDPVEYLHKHNRCIINQIEVRNDTMKFSYALRNALRQDPDIILVGEMRDLETISTAITAAETGHLVLSTVHTIGAAKTIDRILDVFPPNQQHQVKVQLASVLKGVISQQILPKKDGNGRVAAFEIMLDTTAIENLIREGKTHQIQTVIQTNSKLGMITMDASLTNLYNKKLIDKETLLRFAIDRDAIRKRLSTFM